MTAEHSQTSGTASGFTHVATRRQFSTSLASETHSLRCSSNWTRLASHFTFATDDYGVQQDPIRHVDYLGHDWSEEDVSSSWRYLASSKKTIASHTRLKNAAWRAWAKRINSLSTLDPKELNWSKEHDITCLFGPLQPGVDCNGSGCGASLTHSPPYASATILKSIMRKRSIREMMLQRSVYTVELLLERMTLSKDGCTNCVLAASPSVADAIRDVTLKKRVHFDVGNHDSTGTEQEITHAYEQRDLGYDLSINF